MKYVRETKIGIIVFAGILLLYWGINYLKGRDFFTRQKLIFAVYDRVDGLKTSNAIEVKGMKIGAVNSLTLNPEGKGSIIVAMHIKSDIEIPRNSVAQIFSSDLLGTKGIRIMLGNATDRIQNGDTLQSEIQTSLGDEVSAQVLPIKLKAENLLASLDSITVVIREVFNEQTKSNLKNSFGSISAALNSIENITFNLDTMMTKQNGRLKVIFENLESITSNLRKNNQQVSDVLDNFSSISDTIRQANLAATLSNAQKTLEHTAVVFEKIDKGKGSLGMLVNDDSLYNNLNATARDMDLLMKDIKANPKRYIHFSVFGSKAKK